MARAMKLHSRLASHVKQAQSRPAAQGPARGRDPFSFYARTCDPAVEYLKRYSKLDDEAIVSQMLTVFRGLGQAAAWPARERGRGPAPAPWKRRRPTEAGRPEGDRNPGGGSCPGIRGLMLAGLAGHLGSQQRLHHA